MGMINMSAPSIEEIAAAAKVAMTRIKNNVTNTPLIQSRVLGQGLYYKTENFQRTGSFKIRGAMSKLTKLMETTKDNNLKLITASSGNHGIGAAAAAIDLGLSMTVVLPTIVAAMKLDRIKAQGAIAILEGAEASASEIHAQKLSSDEGYTYISPYNDADIVAGQGTIGIELLEAFKDRKIDNVFISLGGGGLVSGIGAVIKTYSPETKIWGASAINSAALDASIKAGKVVETEHLETLADAVAGGVDENTITLPLASSVIDECLLCSEAEIEAAFIKLALDEGMIVEGSAALALAAYEQVAKGLAGQTSVILLCGGNINPDLARSLIARSGA